ERQKIFPRPVGFALVIWPPLLPFRGVRSFVAFQGKRRLGHERFRQHWSTILTLADSTPDGQKRPRADPAGIVVPAGPTLGDHSTRSLNALIRRSWRSHSAQGGLR